MGSTVPEAEPIRVAVFGAGGRMGAEVCRAVASDSAFRLVAAVDPHAAGKTLRAVAGIEGNDGELIIDRHVGDREANGVDVAIDFTVAHAAQANLEWCATNAVHAVVGTTGFSDDALAQIATSFAQSACLIAANFAISAVLMMRMAEQAAPYFDSVEIVELHHDQKRDAPSGTAIATAERIARASSDWAADPTEITVLPGARGGVGPAGIPIHSVRLRGLVAHQEVIFGTTGQSLVIRQDSYDRTSFMPGVVAAAKAILDRTGLILGLDSLLFD